MSWIDFLRRWFDHTPPTRPRRPKVYNIQEILMIRTTFVLPVVEDLPDDFDRREVTIKLNDGPLVADPNGPYTKAQLNDPVNPVKLIIDADRLVVVNISQTDYDTSGNSSNFVYSYVVVDTIPPAVPESPLVSSIEEI